MGDKRPVRLAVFDFDGTSITGNSPVMLVWHLTRNRMLKISVILRIVAWAFAYKFRLPQNETWVRCLVFRAFSGKDAAEVDRYLASFYEEKVAPRFRLGAEQAMRRHQEAGDVVVVVSASFEPIILRAMQDHPFSYQASTKMKRQQDGTYINQVDGLPVEGAQKLIAVEHLANREFGKGNWVLAHAYGDHHSDRHILSAAETAHAVTPDRPLGRLARKKGWEILRW